MITVAIAETFFFLENNPLSEWTGGENGIPNVPRGVRPWFRGLAGEIGLVDVCVHVGNVRGRPDVARRIAFSRSAISDAIRDNPLRAAAVGHAVHRYKLTAFAIAAGLCRACRRPARRAARLLPPEAFTFDTSGQLVIQTVIAAPARCSAAVGAAIWLSMQDLLQYTFELGASWKLGLGLFFVALVVLLRRGIIFAVADLLRPWLPAPAPIPTAHARSSARPLVRASRPTAPKGTPVLETRDLTKRYGGIVANSNISFAVNDGELRGVIGPNGAGKSTFFKMLTVRSVPARVRCFSRAARSRGACHRCLPARLSRAIRSISCFPS